MVTTNNKDIYTKLKIYRENGIVKEQKKFSNFNVSRDINGNLNPWYYEVQEIGLNYRLNEICSALGISQLKKLKKFQKNRKKIFDYYNLVFKNKKLIKPFFQIKEQINSMHLYPLLISFDKAKYSRAELMLKLKQNNIFTQVHYIPLHYHPQYKDKFNHHLRGSELYYSRCLSIPVFPQMTIDDAEYVSKNLLKYVD